MKLLCGLALLVVGQAACDAKKITISADYTYNDKTSAAKAKCNDDGTLKAAVKAVPYTADLVNAEASLFDGTGDAKKAKNNADLSDYLSCKKGYYGKPVIKCTEAGADKATASGCAAPTLKCATTIDANADRNEKGVTTAITDAKRLEGQTVNVPCVAGVFSALGVAVTNAVYKCKRTSATAAAWTISSTTCYAKASWYQTCPIPLKGVAAVKATVKAWPAGATPASTLTKPTAAQCIAGGTAADKQCDDKDAQNPTLGAAGCPASTITTKSAIGTVKNGLTCTAKCSGTTSIGGVSTCVDDATPKGPADVTVYWKAPKAAAGSPAAAVSMMVSFVVGVVAMAL